MPTHNIVTPFVSPGRSLVDSRIRIAHSVSVILPPRVTEFGVPSLRMHQAINGALVDMMILEDLQNVVAYEALVVHGFGYQIRLLSRPLKRRYVGNDIHKFFAS